jgi:putative lipoic acid-binding regulatory protein
MREVPMNTSLPTLDLLDKTHTFPCPYLFKIIGKANQGFMARVVAAVREELLAEVDPPYRVRETVSGRHISVTVEPVVHSAQQVVAIYRRLGAVDGLVLLF